MKHYDNKNDLISQLRKQKYRTEKAIEATFTAYMMLATLTLYEDLGFREKRLLKFVNGFYDRLALYEDGKLTVDAIEKTLLEKAGVVVEGGTLRLKDLVHHPAHYCYSEYEPKDVIRAWGLNFNLGSAVKYIARAGRKDDILQELNKAKQFIEFEIEAIEKERSKT